MNYVILANGQNVRTATVMSGEPNPTAICIYQGLDGRWYSRLGLRKFKDDIPPALRCDICAFGFCIHGRPVKL